MVKTLRDEHLSAPLDGGKNPWLALIVTVCTLAKVDFVRGRVSEILSRQGKDGIGWDQDSPSMGDMAVRRVILSERNSKEVGYPRDGRENPTVCSDLGDPFCTALESY